MPEHTDFFQKLLIHPTNKMITSQFLQNYRKAHKFLEFLRATPFIINGKTNEKELSKSFLGFNLILLTYFFYEVFVAVSLYMQVKYFSDMKQDSFDIIVTVVWVMGYVWAGVIMLNLSLNREEMMGIYNQLQVLDRKWKGNYFISKIAGDINLRAFFQMLL